MNARQNKFILWSVAGALGALSLVTLAGAALLPYGGVQAPKPLETIAIRPGTRPSAAVPPLDAFVEFWDRPLRRPLVDSPETAVPSTQTVATAELRLVGTIVEPGHSYALFSTPDGQLQFKEVGAQVAGAEVVEINEGTVKVRTDGREDTLAMPVPQP